MRFRTETECRPSAWKINHDTPLVMLGSCFTDEIGSRLDSDGFQVIHNPFGPLYNPISVTRCLMRAAKCELYNEADLTEGPRGYHCLDYASRFSGNDQSELLASINSTLLKLHCALTSAPVLIITLGSAFVFELMTTGVCVGNCHKFPADRFKRRLLSTDEIFNSLANCIQTLRDTGVEKIIFTVSPIRHLADGLHGNTLSKGTLHVALNRLLEAYPDLCSYFPSYEIMIDDLRDYRFYAPDMKHPSEVAVEYIYGIFADTYFSKETRKLAEEFLRRQKAALHRQIL